MRVVTHINYDLLSFPVLIIIKMDAVFRNELELKCPAPTPVLWLHLQVSIFICNNFFSIKCEEIKLLYNELGTTVEVVVCFDVGLNFHFVSPIYLFLKDV
jgi:hypothetical protein